MAAEGGEYTREKEKQKQQVATGGAEQERKGAPRCVRVSVPVRPDLCLSDRQRRERKTRERRRSHSAKTRREKFACPKPEPDSITGGGGWVGASSSRRSKQVACAFRSSHLREEEEERKRRKRKTIRGRQFSNHNPKPKRTFRNKQTTRRIHLPRDKEKKRAAFRAVVKTYRVPNSSRLGADN